MALCWEPDLTLGCAPRRTALLELAAKTMSSTAPVIDCWTVGIACRLPAPNVDHLAGRIAVVTARTPRGSA